MMIDWLMKLDVNSKIALVVAVIGVGGGIIVAIINGIFSVISKNKNSVESKNKNSVESKYTIQQTAYDNATQIGIQISKKEGE